MDFDTSDLKVCVEKYILLPQSTRMKILYNYPLFKQFYFFMTGQFPELLKNDLEELEQYQFTPVRQEFNVKHNIPIVDFSNPDDNFGYPGDIVFDVFQNRYFKFGYGYLDDNEIIVEVSNRATRSFLPCTEEVFELTENLHIATPSFEENIHINDNDDIIYEATEQLEDAYIEYNPQSPNYNPNDMPPTSDNDSDCSVVNIEDTDDAGHPLITIDEAKVLENMFKENINDKNVIKQRLNFRNVNSDLREIIDARKEQRVNDAQNKRRELRKRELEQRRTSENSITMYSQQEIQPKDANMEIGDRDGNYSFDELGSDNIKFKILRYIYQEKETLISADPQIRSYVSGRVAMCGEFYFAKEIDTELIQGILNSTRLKDILIQLRSSSVKHVHDIDI